MIGSDSRGKNLSFNFRFMIGLHIDDLAVLEFIKNKLGCGYITVNNTNTSCYFIITNPQDLVSILFPILDTFHLNTTKYLDYLNFKEAVLLNLKKKSKDNSSVDNIDIITTKIVNLKNTMNNKRTDFKMLSSHIKITPYWLLGLIEGEGSFFLNRGVLIPTFKITLTELQLPVIEQIIEFLKQMLDPYSLVKAENTQLFNLSFEKPKGNSKGKVSLTIVQLDYIVNIFIPFIKSLTFHSKKQLDFINFCQIAELIYEGKHFISFVKTYILQLSYTMNNYRLSTNTSLIANIISRGIIIANYNLSEN